METGFSRNPSMILLHLQTRGSCAPPNGTSPRQSCYIDCGKLDDMRLRALHLGLIPILAVAARAAVPNQYVVEIAGDPVAVHVARHAAASGIHGAAATARRVQIREEQHPVRAQLELAGAHVADSLDTL